MQHIEFVCVCVLLCVRVVRRGEMTVFIGSILLVICSGLAHAVWNLFAKQSTEKNVFLWAILVPTTLILLPSFVVEAMHTELTIQGALLIALSLLLQAGYALLLTETYKYGDLSQVYPIMRGTSTLFIPTIGVVFFAESFSMWGWIGLGCIVVGLFVMSGWKPGKRVNQPQLQLRSVLLAFAVGLCITLYVMVDKLNLQNYSPLFLLEVGNIGFLLGITKAAFASGQLKEQIRAHWKLISIGSVLNPGSYLLFLFAISLSPVSHISPIREIGIVFGTILGVLVLKEKQGTQRVLSSTLVALGITVIAVFGA